MMKGGYLCPNNCSIMLKEVVRDVLPRMWERNKESAKFCTSCGARLRGEVRSQPSAQKGVGPMIKLLGQLIVLVGLLVLLWGGFGFFTNQPVKFDPSKSKVHPIFGRNDLLNLLETQAENMERKYKRSEAQKHALWGVIIIARRWSNSNL
jgi:hypothetical protein